MLQRGVFRDRRTGELVTVPWREIWEFSRNSRYDPTFETWAFLKGREKWNSPSMKLEDKLAFTAWGLSMLRSMAKKGKSLTRLRTLLKSTSKN